MTLLSRAQKRLFLGLLIFLSSGVVMAQVRSPLKSRLPVLSQEFALSQDKNLRQASILSAKSNKISPTLQALSLEFKQRSNVSEWQNYASTRGYHQSLVLIRNFVVIEAIAESDPEELLAQLKQLGMPEPSTFGRVVSGLFPLSAIDQLEGIDALRFVRTGFKPMVQVGAVTSQGDQAQSSDLARNLCGLNGAGTTVGILSDSYNTLGGAANGIASGDLPGPGNPNGFSVPVNILSDVPEEFADFVIDEGRGMAELIHDVAPGAELAFHSAVFGQADFANGIIELAEQAGSDVIVDDIIYFSEPMFQDGIIAQAADIVESRGVPYFSSAGNSARQSYESAFRPSTDTIKLAEGDGFPLGDYLLHDFDPGPGVDYFQKVLITGGNTISFQWSDAFASICPTSLGASSDLDIFIFVRDGDFNSAIFGSRAGNIGADPVEVASFETDFFVEAYIVVGKFLGIPEFGFVLPPSPNPEFIKYVYFGGPLNEEYATFSGTAFGHANAAGAIAVGAVRYDQTPVFGVTSPIVEGFSSAGGVPILRDVCGLAINPEIRQKPEVSGPDGSNTTFFGGQDLEGDGFPNFFGTSASAPHVAAIAALMKQADSGLSPNRIKTVLQETALDMDDPATPELDPGFDFGTGFGFVQALEALGEVSTCQGIAAFELYNADTDQIIRVIENGDLITLDETMGRNLAIRLRTFPESLGSVQIDISGDLNSSRLENVAPYTSFGDVGMDLGTDFNGQTFPFGTFEPTNFTVTATAFSARRGEGSVIAEISVNFSLTQPLLNSFSLIDPATDQELGILGNFQIINTSITGQNLNIKVNAVDEDAIGSVGLVLQNTDIAGIPTGLVLDITENVAPFTLFGDNGPNDFKDGGFVENFYLLTATPFSGKNRTGVVGDPIQLIFAVSNDGGLPDGLPTFNQSLKVSAYPNPVGNFENLNIGWEQPVFNKTPVTIRLFNQIGEEIYTAETTDEAQGQFQVNLYELKLPKGLYILKAEKPGAPSEIRRIFVNE